MIVSNISPYYVKVFVGLVELKDEKLEFAGYHLNDIVEFDTVSKQAKMVVTINMVHKSNGQTKRRAATMGFGILPPKGGYEVIKVMTHLYDCALIHKKTLTIIETEEQLIELEKND